MSKPLTIADFREAMADLLPDRREALLGVDTYDRTDITKALGLRDESQFQTLQNLGHIPAPIAWDAERNRALYDLAAVERLRDIKDNGTLWTTGQTAAEQAERDAVRASATISFEAASDALKRPIQDVKASFHYHHLENLRYEDGKSYMTPKQLKTLEAHRDGNTWLSTTPGGFANSQLPKTEEGGNDDE